MMIGWSEHQYLTDPREPIVYALAPTVEKPVAGRTEVIRRDPAPELLVGEPRLLLSAFELLTSETRVRSCTFSFAAEDVDLHAFNAGDPELRRRIGTVLELTQAFAFAGVPPSAQLPRMVTTHTHAGHFELNFVWPRAVIGGHGKLLNVNPHSLRKASKDAWDALRDFLNHRFGWADPLDPRRKPFLLGPSYLEKQAAEAIRLGRAFGPDQPGLMLLQRIRAQQAIGMDRAALRRVLRESLAELGWVVLGRSEARLTVGAPEGASSKRPRVVLRGALIEADQSADVAFEKRVALRQSELATSKERLVHHWRKRAAENIQEYGKGAWPAPPDPEHTIEHILSGPGLPLPAHRPDRSRRRPVEAKIPSAGISHVAGLLAARIDALVDALYMRRHLPRFAAMCAELTPLLRRTATCLETRDDRERRRKSDGGSERPDDAADRTAGTNVRHTAGIDPRPTDRGDDLRAQADQRVTGFPGPRPDGTRRDERPVRPPRANGPDRPEGATATPAVAGSPAGWSRGDWLRATSRAVGRVFPEDAARYRFVATPEDGEVLTVALAGGTVHLRPAGLFLAAGQIDGHRIEQLADQLGLRWDWAKDAKAQGEQRAPDDEPPEEDTGPGW